MKRLFLILPLLACLFVPVAQAQEPEDYYVYLPIILKEPLPWCEDYPFIMSDFKIVVPEATINYCRLTIEEILPILKYLNARA